MRGKERLQNYTTRSRRNGHLQRQIKDSRVRMERMGKLENGFSVSRFNVNEMNLFRRHYDSRKYV